MYRKWEDRCCKNIFENVFSEEFWFLIPEYQRSYVWDTDKEE